MFDNSSWCDPNKNPGPQHPTNHERSLSSSSKGWFWGVLRASSWLLLATPIRTLGVYLHSWSILQHLRFQKRPFFGSKVSWSFFFYQKKVASSIKTTNPSLLKKTEKTPISLFVTSLVFFLTACVLKSSTGVPSSWPSWGIREFFRESIFCQSLLRASPFSEPNSSAVPTPIGPPRDRRRRHRSIFRDSGPAEARPVILS